jgi:drug/metabolite transporter (DMT)-like permease
MRLRAWKASNRARLEPGVPGYPPALPDGEHSVNPARRRIEGVVALVCVQLCLGLSPLFAKWTLVHPAGAPGGPVTDEGFTPRALVAWRILFGAVCLGALAAWKHGRALVPPRAELGRLVLCAALGIVFNMWLYMEGVARTSALHTGLLVVQIPVFTYAVACLARVERPRRRRVLGIAVALAGAVVIVLEQKGEGGGGGSTLGNLLIVTNCLSYAVYLVLARGLLQRFPTLVVIAWVFWCSLPAVPLLFLGVPAWPAAATARVCLSFAYTLVFGTFLAYLLNAFALARVPASTVAVFIFLQPLVAGAAGVLALDERITLPVVLAGALLLAGIVLVALARPENAPGTSDSIQRVAGRVFQSRR